MKKVKEERGAIALIVLVSMLFLVSFLISSYIITSNRAKMEIELTEELAKTYDNTEEFTVYDNPEGREYIPIYTLEQLKTALETTGNTIEINGQTYEIAEDSYIALQNDIEYNEGNYTISEDGVAVFDSSTATQWIPIDVRDDFEGTIDGLGHTISGLYISNTSEGMGLLKDNRGTVKNLIINNSSFSARGNLGSIAGENYGIIENCYVNAFVEGNRGTDLLLRANIGGIAGNNTEDGIIRNCTSIGNMTARTSSVAYKNFGGIAGYNNGTIQNCKNYMQITINTSVNINQIGGISGEQSTTGTVQGCENHGIIKGVDRVGGIVGISVGEIRNCQNEALIENQSAPISGTKYAIGGIVGTNNDEIYKCSNTGNIMGNSITAAGGIVGNYEIIISSYTGKLEECFNSGSVQGKQVGGIVGILNAIRGNVFNSYNKSSSITGDAEYSGGIVGDFKKGTVSYCYNIGTISSDRTIAGTIEAPYAGKIQDCYANRDSGLYLFRVYNSSDGTSSMVDNDTTKNLLLMRQTDMQDPSFAVTLNNNADPAIWQADLNPNINNGYPILSWQH